MVYLVIKTNNMTRSGSVMSLFILLIILGNLVKVSAQYIIENPIVGPVDNNNMLLQIDRVIFTDTGTSVIFTVKQKAGDKINISTKSYISIEDDTAKYYVRHAYGVQLGNYNTIPKEGFIRYRLEFCKSEKQSGPPPAYIQFAENHADGVHFYAIYTNDSLLPFPKYLNGNWYKKESGGLDFIIRPDVVIKNGNIYKVIAGKHKKGELRLQDRLESQQTLYYKQLPDGSCQLGFSKENNTVFRKNRKACTQLTSDTGFSRQMVKFDSCVLEGYIWGYRKSQKEKVITIYVNNVLTGNQDVYAIEIGVDGGFTAKIPIYASNYLMISSRYGHKNIIMEPGKKMFIMLGDTADLYMGEMANFNYDMDLLHKLVHYNFYGVSEKVGKIPTQELKRYIEQQAAVGYTLLDSINSKVRISRKAYAFEKADIDYNVVKQLLSYEIDYNIGYINQYHKVPSQILPESIPDSGYYSFLTDSLVNNPDFLFHPGGDICVNRLKYLNLLRTRGLINSVSNIAGILEDKSIPYTKQEVKIINDPSPYDLNIKDTATINTYNRQCKKFVDKYSFEAELYLNRDYRDSVLNTMDIRPGLASDIMMIQDFASRVKNQCSPVDNATLKRIKHALHEQRLAGFIASLNNNMIAEIEANKHKGGYINRTNEGIPAKLLWDSIVKQFKGNVLYVDFWETWCGPCREAIKRIVPVKKHLEGKPVKFIYIASHSSPMATWQNFLPTIRGEHYRLNDDQYKFLQKRLNIIGMPHVLIVDKTGKIVDPYYQEINPERIRKKIESYL